jgi:Predicted transcriptional regulator
MPANTVSQAPLNLDTLPDGAWLRDKQIAGPVLPIARCTLWAWVREGRFPKPVKLSPRVTAWKVGDVRGFIASQVNA